MNGEYFLTVQLSTAWQTLQKADEILSLIKLTPVHERTLSACAVIILAASLDQGTNAVLSVFATQYATENDIEISATPFAAILKDSLRRRVQSVPKILSANRFQLNPHSPITKNLQDLISLRNDLVHINDEVQVLTSDNPRLSIEDNTINVKLEQLPVNPWDVVIPNKVLDYAEAVRLYFEDALFPPYNKIRENSPLLIKTSSSSKLTNS